MPRKIRTKRQAGARKISRGEIALYVLGAVVALSMIFGTIFSAVVR